MPFVRTSRDKRGYEHIYLIDTSSKRGRAPASRVLYWFRTPPGVKVGREPFDDGTRRTLEARYPGLIFDWKKLANTPMPPPDTEHWRERRRLERTTRQARAAEEREDEALQATLAAAAPASDEQDVADVADEPGVPARDISEIGDVADVADLAAPQAESTEVAAATAPAPLTASTQAGADAPVAGQARDSQKLEPRRRRRRGGRRRRRPQGSQGSPGAAPEITAAAGPDRSTLIPHEEE